MNCASYRFRMVLISLILLLSGGILALAQNAGSNSGSTDSQAKNASQSQSDQDPLKRPVKPDQQQKAILEKLSPHEIQAPELAGEKIEQILTTAPGDGNAIGGVKVIAKDGWFAARPSGTEEIYKIYAESFQGVHHLRQIQEEAQTIVGQALAGRSVARAGKT